jgi:hypothetical protein
MERRLAAVMIVDVVDRLAIKIQGVNVSGLEAMSRFPFKQMTDTDRLLDGLRRQGCQICPSAMTGTPQTA